MTPPGRSSTGTGPVRSSTVDSSPIGHGPPSRISGDFRRPNSAATCGAVVGLTRPERLAEGAAIGRPAARSSACATGCAGARTASVSRPALASSDTPLSSRRRQHQGQRAGPEPRAIASRARSSNDRERLGLGETRDMHDQRIEARPAFRREDACDGARRSWHRRRARTPSRSETRRVRHRAASARLVQSSPWVAGTISSWIDMCYPRPGVIPAKAVRPQRHSMVVECGNQNVTTVRSPNTAASPRRRPEPVRARGCRRRG